MVKNKLLEIRLQMAYKKQKDFAEFLGLDSWLYNRYENNAVQPGSETLLLICEKTGRKIEEVIYRVPNE